jgi:hypothetical protein
LRNLFEQDTNGAIRYSDYHVSVGIAEGIVRNKNLDLSTSGLPASWSIYGAAMASIEYENGISTVDAGVIL